MITMLAVGAGVRKLLATSITFEGLLSGMKPGVLGEMVLMLEGLIALAACIRPQIYKMNEMDDVLYPGHEAQFSSSSLT